MNSFVVVLPTLPVMPTTLAGPADEDVVGQGLEGGDVSRTWTRPKYGSPTATGLATIAPAAPFLAASATKS